MFSNVLLFIVTVESILVWHGITEPALSQIKKKKKKANKMHDWIQIMDVRIIELPIMTQKGYRLPKTQWLIRITKLRGILLHYSTKSITKHRKAICRWKQKKSKALLNTNNRCHWILKKMLITQKDANYSTKTWLNIDKTEYRMY